MNNQDNNPYQFSPGIGVNESVELGVPNLNSTKALNTSLPIKPNAKTFWIRSFGCQMNLHDSQRMAQQLVSLGLNSVSDPKQADLVIINTCSVRAKPEHKALSEAGRYQWLKRSRGSWIVLAGCVAQQEGERLLQKAPYLDAIMGPDAICRLPEIVAKMEQGKTNLLALEEHDALHPCFVPLGPCVSNQVSLPVTIMKGCDNFCSYCVVPFVRGCEVSRPLPDILEEVEQLALRGCREVVLLGQNVNSYRDPNGVGFPDLLTSLDRQAAVDRIRFTTSHPKNASLKLVETMATLGRLCEHVHLGLQSGSNRILGMMNRGYTREEFADRVEAFRRLVPGISVTTDIIVGFPSETEEDFQQTLEVVEVSKFDQAFSFKYSPRPGTAAACLADDVGHEDKARRLAELQDVLARNEAASLARLAGSVSEILVEGPSLRDEQAFCGRTRCNRVVNFTSESAPRAGELVEVQLLQVRGHTLWGDALNSESRTTASGSFETG